MTVRLSTGTRNAIGDSGVGPLFDTDGAISFYTGSQPAAANDDVSGTLLGTCTFSADWIGAFAAGVGTVAAITNDSSADASGTPGWFRIHDVSEGPGGSSTTKRRIDGSVTATGGGGDITFNTTTWVAGGVISMTSLTLTIPAS